MAERDSTQCAVINGCEPAGTGIDFHAWPSESILRYIDRLADEINETGEQIAAVAYGGESYARGPDASGNPIDGVCQHMFGAIAAMSESARPYLEIKRAIDVLCARVKKGGVQ